MIYFIRAKVTKKIKIGFTTKSISERMYPMHSVSPDSLIFIGGMAGGQAEEKQLHHKFKCLHSHGEWFNESRELLCFINTKCLISEDAFDVLCEWVERDGLSLSEASKFTEDEIIKISSERFTKAINSIYTNVTGLSIIETN